MSVMRLLTAIIAGLSTAVALLVLLVSEWLPSSLDIGIVISALLAPFIITPAVYRMLIKRSTLPKADIADDTQVGSSTRQAEIPGPLPATTLPSRWISLGLGSVVRASFSAAKSLVIAAAFLVLIITNILSFTSAAFHIAVSGMLSATAGIETVMSKVLAQNAERKVVVKRIGGRIAGRTRKLVVSTVASLPGEAIPYLGVGVLLAATAYELKVACDNIKDIEELHSVLEIEPAEPDAMNAVCNTHIPSL